MANERKFKKVNDLPIEIEHVVDENDHDYDYETSFWFNGRRHYFKDLVRVHDNPWTGVIEGIPDYIDAYEMDYSSPIYVEVFSDEALNVYEEVTE